MSAQGPKGDYQRERRRRLAAEKARAASQSISGSQTYLSDRSIREWYEANRALVDTYVSIMHRQFEAAEKDPVAMAQNRFDSLDALFHRYGDEYAKNNISDFYEPGFQTPVGVSVNSVANAVASAVSDGFHDGYTPERDATVAEKRLYAIRTAAEIVYRERTDNMRRPAYSKDAIRRYNEWVRSNK